MKIIQSNILPPKGYKAINLFGIVFVRPDTELTDTDIRHEQIHTAQMRETLYVGFYILYLLFFLYHWARRGFAHWSDAYHANPLEAEAYANQDNPTYLGDEREYYAWIDYLSAY